MEAADAVRLPSGTTLGEASPEELEAEADRRKALAEDYWQAGSCQTTRRLPASIPVVAIEIRHHLPARLRQTIRRRTSHHETWFRFDDAPHDLYTFTTGVGASTHSAP